MTHVCYFKLQTNVSATATVGRITDLKPFTNYTCTLHAVAASVGSKSNPITATTDQKGWYLVKHTQNSNNLIMLNVSASNPPVILSVTTIDSQSVNVTWRAPTQPNGVLISYTITYTIDDNSSEATLTVPYERNVSNWVFNMLYHTVMYQCYSVHNTLINACRDRQSVKMHNHFCTILYTYAWYQVSPIVHTVHVAHEYSKF